MRALGGRHTLRRNGTGASVPWSPVGDDARQDLDNISATSRRQRVNGGADSARRPGEDDRAASGPDRSGLDLAVILCVRNGARTIRGQLDALAAQEWDGRWEVVIVDNDSTDATPRVVAEFAASHPRFRVVDARERHGLSHARNVGVANTTAAAVAFCDDDDLVGEQWVAAMGTALRDHPIVACRFEWSQDHLEPGRRSLPGGVFQHDGIEEVFGFPVAAGVGGWQRWLWLALGGNDESLTFTGEDFDMSIRAYREHGVTPYFEPAAVYHIARRSGLRANFRQARRYGRAAVVLYARYGRGRVDRRPETRRALRSWGWLVTHPLVLRDEERGVHWVRIAGTRLGRLEQSVRSRTVWL
jgi:glycosyltransferase involved in cell wall biosynthesis